MKSSIPYGVALRYKAGCSRWTGGDGLRPRDGLDRASTAKGAMTLG